MPPGMAIVVVRALISDRLRRRDDISVALGVPVKLSVGAVKRARFSLNPRVRKARESNLRRVAMYLRIAAPRKERAEARTLAVLPVDNAKTMVPVVSRLAESCAKDGMRIVVADLVKGSPLARALGVGGGAGIRSAQLDGAHIVVVVPEPDDIAPAGPLRPVGTAPLATLPSEDLLTAFRRDPPPAARWPWLVALAAAYLLVAVPLTVLQTSGKSAWVPDTAGLYCVLAALACLAHAPRAWSRQAADSDVWSLTLTLLAAQAGAYRVLSLTDYLHDPHQVRVSLAELLILVLAVALIVPDAIRAQAAAPVPPRPHPGYPR